MIVVIYRFILQTRDQCVPACIYKASRMSSNIYNIVISEPLRTALSNKFHNPTVPFFSPCFLRQRKPLIQFVLDVAAATVRCGHRHSFSFIENFKRLSKDNWLNVSLLPCLVFCASGDLFLCDLLILLHCYDWLFLKLSISVCFTEPHLKISRQTSWWVWRCFQWITAGSVYPHCRETALL